MTPEEHAVVDAALKLTEAIKPKARRVLEVAAFMTILPTGKLTDPVDIDEGDELYLSPVESPGAGTISRDMSGQIIALAGGMLAAGTIGAVISDLYEKRWVLGPGGKDGNCEDCEGNADDGWIPADEEFSSGHDSPEAHLNCTCSLETRLAGEDDGED